MALLVAVYAVALVAGLLALPSPDAPIGDPIFSILEVLIVLLMPLVLALFVAIEAWAPPGRAVFARLALVFAGLLAGLTCSVHFAILTLGRQPAFADLPVTERLLSFHWPSVAYALDILAWDVFFPLAALSAALVFGGGRLASTVRILLAASGVLALGGLSGLVGGDMQLRNIGILGYAGVFPIAAVLLAVLFYLSPARAS